MPNDYSALNYSAETDLDRCRSYMLYQLSDRKQESVRHRWPPPGPAITISDLTGSGAHEIGRRLAELLQAEKGEDPAPWAVFDRQLLEKVLEDHHLPARLAKFMPEDRRSYLTDVLDELAGLRPPSWVLVPKVVESILHLAETGHVILVGRGANFITARMPNVFHVRLVASLAKRVERVQHIENLSPKDAARFIARSDRGRGRYARAYFHTRADDNQQYHLVLNTDRIPLSDAAQLIAVAALKCFQAARAKM